MRTAVIASLAAAAVALWTLPAHTQLYPLLDHFQCYKVKDLKVPSKFAPVTATTADQFGSQVLQAKKPFMICNPTDKNGSGIRNPVEHLCCYKVKASKQTLPTVTISDQFGTRQWEVKKKQLLCNPCLKNFDAQ